MKPKISDLITYINKALTGNDWNTNWQKIVNWLTLGTYDLKVNKIETNEIENSGSFQANQVIADNVQADTVTANSFVGDGSQLDNVRVTNTFPYTPFSINSAKDSFIDITDTSKLVFLVDDGTLYKPLIVTTANGKQITITSINDYDVSGLNGTYYIFADEETNGGTVYLKACDIYRQNVAPTGNNGDIWLDISNEPYICREKVSSNWYGEEYNKVPLAKVVITGGAIDSLEMLAFNNNDVDIKVVESYTNGKDWYKIYSNGDIEQGGQADGGSNQRSLSGTINFLKEFKDTSYTFVFTPLKDSTSGGIMGQVGSRNKETSSIYVGFYGNSGDDTARYFMWIAKGKI